MDSDQAILPDVNPCRGMTLLLKHLDNQEISFIAIANETVKVLSIWSKKTCSFTQDSNKNRNLK